MASQEPLTTPASEYDCSGEMRVICKKATPWMTEPEVAELLAGINDFLAGHVR